MSRSHIQAALSAMAGECASGARVAWLVGTEGLGKSTLARSAAEASGQPVHRLDIYPEDRSRPLSAAHELAALLGASIGPDSAHDLLRALEGAGPITLMIEDAQWMDEASQEAIWQVIRRFRRLPIWLVITSTNTSGVLLEGLSLLLRSPDRGQLFSLAPLTAFESGAFLRRELGVPIKGETLDRVQAVTAGYPSLLSSLADQVRLGGLGTTVRSTLAKVAERPEQGSGLLREHVSAALAAASPSSRAVLVALALAGELSAAQLASVLHSLGLQDAVTEELLLTGLVEPIGPSSFHLRYEPARRAIEQAVSWSELRASHAALATALRGLDALEHRIVAATEADLPELFAEVHAQLIEAYGAQDLTLAFRLAQYAADMDPSFTIEVILAVLRSGRTSRLGDIEDRIENMQPSIARTAAMTILTLDHSNLPSVVERLSKIAVEEVHDVRELTVFAQACVQVVMRANLSTRPGLVRPFSPLVPRLKAAAAAFLEVRPDLGAELLANVYGLEVALIGLDDSVEPALRIEPLTLLRDQLDPVTAGVIGPLIRPTVGLMHFVTGDLGAAKDHLSQGALDIPFLSMQINLALAQIAFLSGSWDEAHAIADQQLAQSLDSLQSLHWPQCFAVAALVPAVRGEESVLAEYLGWQEMGQPTVGTATAKLAKVWALTASGSEPDTVASLLDQVWERGDVSYLSAQPTGVLRVRSHLALGDRRCAEAARAALESEPYESQAHAYALAHADALLEADLRHWVAALELFAVAARHLRAQARGSLGAPLRVYEFILAEDWAGAVEASGSAPGLTVSALLNDTVTLLGAQGAPVWRDRLRGLKRRLGATAEALGDRAPVPDAFTGLTSREREVAILAAGGLSNREIAERLFVTVRTAEYHVHNALSKMGLSSRAQLPSLTDRA